MNDDYRLTSFSASRLPMIDYMAVVHGKHLIHGLFEVDVTSARQFIRDYKARTGEALSLTAFIASCVGRAVESDRRVQAYRNWRNQLVIYNDVDVNILVEREAGTTVIGTPLVIRAANTKTLRQIHNEIRSAQTTPAPEFKRVDFYRFVPGFIRRSFWWLMLHHPPLMKRIAGTVTITAIGMFGKGAGWGIPMTGYTLSLAVGGIDRKPRLIDGRLAEREYLCLTISVDHDVVDGAPAARFAARLTELIEEGISE